MKIKVYDKDAKNIKSVNFNIVDNGVNHDLITQYIRIYQLNQRQGTVKVKTRSEVRGGGRKPWKQKGTGRARAGTIRSPLWRGGGITHGPVPKEWNLSLNKKTKKKIFADSIILKINEDKLMSFVGFESLENPSTKITNKFLEQMNLKNNRILIIHDKSDVLFKSFRNIKGVRVKSIDDLSAYDILSADYVLIDSQAVSLVEQRIR